MAAISSDSAKPRLRACVDIGSNTTRVLVAEVGPGGLREVIAERQFTRLLRGCGADGSLAAYRIGHVAEVVAAQLERARGAGCREVRVVATAAVRRAPNRDELLEAVRRVAGCEVEVLSAEEEARLAFEGATAGLAPRPTGVVDVGGGSCELVVGTPGLGAEWTTSLPIGSAVLADAYLHSDPPSRDELDALRTAVRRAFAGVQPPPSQLAVAVGGSATSLARLAGPVLDAPALARALETVIAGRARVVAADHSLDPERVRLLPAGLAVLACAARTFASPLAVAAGGLREGVLLEDS
jgi:exopolyphosphatase / guanosine-5'-triphosphate,3'-diphosphate pyrophosphatase